MEPFVFFLYLSFFLYFCCLYLSFLYFCILHGKANHTITATVCATDAENITHKNLMKQGQTAVYHNTLMKAVYFLMQNIFLKNKALGALGIASDN